MKKLLFVGSLVLASFIGAVHADDQSDVQAVMDAVVAAANALDMDEEEQYYISEATEFRDNGGTLQPLNWEGAREGIKNGAKWTVKHGKNDIAIHGTAAVVAGHAKGDYTAPDGWHGEWMTRYTWVLAKKEGAWKIVHRHHSRGVFVPAESEE